MARYCDVHRKDAERVDRWKAVFCWLQEPAPGECVVPAFVLLATGELSDVEIWRTDVERGRRYVVTQELSMAWALSYAHDELAVECFVAVAPDSEALRDYVAMFEEEPEDGFPDDSEDDGADQLWSRR